MFMLVGCTFLGTVLCGILGFVVGGTISDLLHPATHGPDGAIWGVFGAAFGALIGFFAGGILGFRMAGPP